MPPVSTAVVERYRGVEDPGGVMMPPAVGMSPGLMATLAGTQTLTNKTLTSPVINLANSDPTADGGIGFNQTNEDLSVGDGSTARKIHMGAWGTFSPAWVQSAGGTPAFGNAAINCRYTTIGRMCTAKYNINFGTSTVFAGTDWGFGLPINAVNVTTHGVSGASVMNDASGTVHVGIAEILSGSLVFLYPSSSPSTSSSGTGVPFVWTSGDMLGISITYEI